MPKISLKKEQQNRIRFLSEQEEIRLLTTTKQFGYADQRDAMECLLYTGFRCSELWRLEKRDVDFNHGTITLWRTKGGRPRTVPIVDKIRPILQARCESCSNDTGKLFPGASNDWLRWAWERVRQHMGLADDPQFVPHMLRHTCATRLAQRGVSMPVLKELVAYLIIERMYKEMASMPDGPVIEGRRTLRTILVIDEAHNYLSQKNIFLQKIIREGRSKGVVVFFASQSPNDYQQDFFNFQELLEFAFIFQCEGVAANSIQKILGCTSKTAKDLQTEVARLEPWHGNLPLFIRVLK